MVLYHGTNQVIREIDLSKGKLRTDFGKGFYLGSNLGVAREWAKSKARFSGTPVVIQVSIHTPLALTYLDTYLIEYQEMLENETWTKWLSI